MSSPKTGLTRSFTFLPHRMLLRGGRSREAVLLWLLICAVAIPSGSLTRIFEWSGMAVQTGGATIHLTLYIPMLLCVPLVLWYGYLWAAIPAYCSTFVIALMGGMPLPWAFLFSLANPVGLAIYAMAYRVTRLRNDLRDTSSIVGFVMISLVSALAGSVGAFVWVYTNKVGANTAYPIWQGWWLGGWLQAVLIAGPILWLLSPIVSRWLEPARAFEPTTPKRHLRQRLLPAVVSTVSVLLMYVGAARLFSMRQLSELDADPEQMALVQNAVDSLSYPLFVLVAAMVAVAFFGYRAAIFWNRQLLDANNTLSAQNSELTRLATTDALTGIFNRRKVLEMLQAEFLRARRTGMVMSVLMIDADHFKRVNDEHGHLVGDAVIAALAQRLHSALRDYDVLGRYGGEEFIVMLPETKHPDAAQVAERILQNVVSAPVCDNPQIEMTVSIGFATMRPQDESDSCVIDRADRALLQAKNSGRNCIVSGHFILASSNEPVAAT